MRRIYTYFYLIVIGLLYSSRIDATTYVAKKSGKWSSKKIWYPEYPGTELSEQDTIIISGLINVNASLNLEGTIIIDETGFLMASKEEIVLERTGTMINNGIIITKTLVNNGTIVNNQNLENTTDLMNEGTIVNNEMLFMGDYFKNRGSIIRSNESFLFADDQIESSEEDYYESNIEVCPINYKTTKSDCSCMMDFYPKTGISASIKLINNIVKLGIVNKDVEGVKYYKIERSTNGTRFEVSTYIHSEFIENADDKDYYILFSDQYQFYPNAYYRITPVITSEDIAKPLPRLKVSKI